MYLKPWSRLFRKRLVQSRRRRRRRVPQVSSRIEQLEDRTPLSSASFADGVFAFTSDAGPFNNVTVTESGGQVTTVAIVGADSVSSRKVPEKKK